MPRKKVAGVKRGRTVARNVAANKIPPGGKTSLLRVKFSGQKRKAGHPPKPFATVPVRISLAINRISIKPGDHQ
jgi:hypothetical protein